MRYQYTIHSEENLQKNAEAENEENKIEREKHLGNHIYYGQIIQLRHEFSNKYIHVSTEKMARVDKMEMRVHDCATTLMLIV